MLVVNQVDKIAVFVDGVGMVIMVQEDCYGEESQIFFDKVHIDSIINALRAVKKEKKGDEE